VTPVVRTTVASSWSWMRLDLLLRLVPLTLAPLLFSRLSGTPLRDFGLVVTHPLRDLLVAIPVGLGAFAIAAADPDWGAGLLGDKAHSMVFDNAKLRSIVPGWRAVIPFEQGAREIVVDLSGMDFIDSTGLGVFVGALKRAREGGGGIELRGLKPSARKVFEITGLSSAFTIAG